MLPKIVFKPSAEFEIRDAFNWYEERATGLGSKFLRNIDACLQLIRRHPNIFPMVEGEIRYAVLRRFPYQIYYLPERMHLRFFCFPFLSKAQKMAAQLILIRSSR